MDLKHPNRCCVFSFLQFVADFLSFLPNKAKNSTFCQIFQFLTLFGMQFKKSAKTHKNEKMQHLMGCFKSKKEFKFNFWILCLFLAYFEQKNVAKNRFLMIFSKMVIFHQNLTLLMCSLQNSLSKNVYFYLL